MLPKYLHSFAYQVSLKNDQWRLAYAKYGSVKLQVIVYQCPLSPSKPISMSGIKTKPQRDYQAWIPAVQVLALSHIGKLKSIPSVLLSF